MTPLNECGACGHDFTSVELFDRHRVGKHAYMYSEGAKWIRRARTAAAVSA
jgi:hypothetical protein